MGSMQRIAPIFSARDLDAAIDHCCGGGVVVADLGGFASFVFPTEQMRRPMPLIREHSGETGSVPL
jgi:hypothetical protein